MCSRAGLADDFEKKKKISRINRDYKHGVMYIVDSYCRPQHFSTQRRRGSQVSPFISLLFGSAVRHFQAEAVFDQRAVSDRSP